MERNELVFLNREEIGKIIQCQELKKWWVAEFAGVHKTTLRRWMSGKIHKVRRSHVKRLAEVLSSPECVISYPALNA